MARNVGFWNHKTQDSNISIDNLFQPEISFEDNRTSSFQLVLWLCFTYAWSLFTIFVKYLFLLKQIFLVFLPILPSGAEFNILSFVSMYMPHKIVIFMFLGISSPKSPLSRSLRKCGPLGLYVVTYVTSKFFRRTSLKKVTDVFVHVEGNSSEYVLPPP